MANLLATPADWPRVLLDREPRDLDDATLGAGFRALRRSVTELGPTGTIATVAASGLRGRGGAGYPTGEKWRAAAESSADRKFVVANGYGADPAVITDATLIQRDPYRLVEGLAIAAYAIGATEAIVAIRADYADAIARLEAAILEAEDAGYVGPDMLGSGHDLRLTIRAVQGAYMLGEETVLLKALEGKRGQPEQRPPYPSERGMFGRPTVVNNVATLAAVPWIITNGPEAYRQIGSPASPGTMLAQVRGPAGDGIAEVPSGVPLRALVGLAGGMPAGRRLKAVLVGGPSGGLLPPELLDTPYEFDALRAAGAHVGSGSVVAVDERACVVDLARLLTRYCADEACGKTIPCRIGTRRIVEIGDRIATGRPRPADVQLLEDLSHDVVASALCDHERLATLPFESGMRYFRAELDDHILRATCPAGVCRPIQVAAAAAQ